MLVFASLSAADHSACSPSPARRGRRSIPPHASIVKLGLDTSLRRC
uniref:Uncharacterized protein n=1 Tax=Setaria italica TaxID=4555 RepID=K4A3Y8_SETIT